MAQRKSTLDAFAPVRARTTQEEEALPPAQQQASSPLTHDQNSAQVAPQTAPPPKTSPYLFPTPSVSKEKRLRDILESVVRQVPLSEPETRRLTLYLPQATYDSLQAVWAGVRERTGIKVSRASLVLAALEIVLSSPQLTESMILATVQDKLVRSGISE